MDSIVFIALKRESVGDVIQLNETDGVTNRELSCVMWYTVDITIIPMKSKHEGMFSSVSKKKNWPQRARNNRTPSRRTMYATETPSREAGATIFLLQKSKNNIMAWFTPTTRLETHGRSYTILHSKYQTYLYIFPINGRWTIVHAGSKSTWVAIYHR